MGRFRILKQLICIIFLSLAPLMQNHRNPLCNSTRGYSAACTAILFFFFLLAFAIGLSVITSIQCCRCQRSDVRTQVLHWQDST